MHNRISHWSTAALFVALGLCLAPTLLSAQVNYDDDIFPRIFQPFCISCHGATSGTAGRRYHTYAHATSGNSEIRAKIRIQATSNQMPPSFSLSAELQSLMTQWEAAGYPERANNEPPQPVDDEDSVAEDGNVNIDVLDNDSDPEDDPLTITAVSNPAFGTAFHDGARVTYTPNDNYHGDDSFTYTVSDGNGNEAMATVDITVTPENDPPDAVDDPDEATDEDQPVLLDVVSNDDDIDGDAFTIINLSDPPNGTAILDGQTLTYTPDENFHGEDSFTYTISDTLLTDTATVTITVAPVNDPPDVTDDEVQTNEDVRVEIEVLADDDDVDGDTLSIESITQPNLGTVTHNGSTVTFTPFANVHGNTSFTYTATDGVFSRVGTVDVTIVSQNDAPAADDDNADTLQNGAVIITVLDNDNDVDGDELTILSTTDPARGNVAIAADAKSVTYTPDLDYLGPDAFTYTITDGQGGEDTATVQVTVLQVQANAGIDQEVDLGTTVFLDGSGSVPLADIVGFSWTHVAGPVVELANADTVQASFEFPTDNDQDITIQLEVTGDTGAMDSDTVTIRARQHVIPLGPGWNLASSPVRPLADIGTIFRDDGGELIIAGPVFCWTGTEYEARGLTDTIEPPNGYWVYNPTGQHTMSLPFAGSVVPSAFTLTADQWHLLGPLSEGLTAGRPNVIAPIWEWTGLRFRQLSVEEILELFDAYWFFSETGGPTELGN